MLGYSIKLTKMFRHKNAFLQHNTNLLNESIAEARWRTSSGEVKLTLRLTGQDRAAGDIIPRVFIGWCREAAD